MSFWTATGMKVIGEEAQLRKLQAGEIQVAVTIGIERTVVVTEMIAVIWEKDEMTETAEDLLSEQSVKKVWVVYTAAELLENHNFWGNFGFYLIINLYEHQN